MRAVEFSVAVSGNKSGNVIGIRIVVGWIFVVVVSGRSGSWVRLTPASSSSPSSSSASLHLPSSFFFLLPGRDVSIQVSGGVHLVLAHWEKGIFGVLEERFQGQWNLGRMRGPSDDTYRLLLAIANILPTLRVLKLVQLCDRPCVNTLLCTDLSDAHHAIRTRPHGHNACQWPGTSLQVVFRG